MKSTAWWLTLDKPFPNQHLMVRFLIDYQLHLFGISTAEESFRQFLEDRIGEPVSLVFTENSITMLSARERGGVLCIRLQRIFLNADVQVLDEIVSYLEGKRRGMACFHAFVRNNRGHIGAGPTKRVSLKTDGRFHDLKELFNIMNGSYFGGLTNAKITWGSRNPRWYVRKRTLGIFSERSNTIRINPVLDRKRVPRYYVSFVIYHEMLHADIGISREYGKRSVHNMEFRKRKKLFKDYRRAIAWKRGLRIFQKHLRLN